MGVRAGEVEHRKGCPWGETVEPLHMVTHVPSYVTLQSDTTHKLCSSDMDDLCQSVPCCSPAEV